MKIIVATDSFKGTLTAENACQIISDVISDKIAGVETIIKPMADGGEGTARAMIAAAGGVWVEKEVTGPLPEMRVKAGYAWFEKSQTALVEMAAASGIELVTEKQKKPLEATTFGTGELIKAALEKKPQKLLLAVGGSATVDGGTGAAAALGWKFLDENGVEIYPAGGNLGRIKSIIAPEKLDLPAVEVLCDVENPLTGAKGAARIYGPQKGATAEMVERLEAGMVNFANVVKTSVGKDIEHLAGAGAAGGLAGGAVAFLDAELVSGIDTVMKLSSLEEAMADADWVITGEGSFDHQSLYGKVIAGITKVAMQKGVKVAVLAGSVSVEAEEYRKMGIEAAVACRQAEMSLEYALSNAGPLLGQAAERLVEEHIIGGEKL